MDAEHIAVGLDGSASSRSALWWAVREAVRRNCIVLAVTACPDAKPPTVDQPVPLALLAAYRMQSRAIDEARTRVPGAKRLVIGREVMVADPVTALAHAGARATLIVLGSDETTGLPETSIAGELSRRLSVGRGPTHRHHQPLIIVVAAQPVDEMARTLATAGV